ncbi:MAG: hypothetical protein ACMXYD_00550 [Candidatus Woesearchaeota archaeon]
MTSTEPTENTSKQRLRVATGLLIAPLMTAAYKLGKKQPWSALETTAAGVGLVLYQWRWAVPLYIATALTPSAQSNTPTPLSQLEEIVIEQCIDATQKDTSYAQQPIDFLYE